MGNRQTNKQTMDIYRHMYESVMWKKIHPQKRTWWLTSDKNEYDGHARGSRLIAIWENGDDFDTPFFVLILLIYGMAWRESCLHSVDIRFEFNSEFKIWIFLVIYSNFEIRIMFLNRIRTVFLHIFSSESTAKPNRSRSGTWYRYSISS